MILNETERDYKSVQDYLLEQGPVNDFKGARDVYSASGKYLGFAVVTRYGLRVWMRYRDGGGQFIDIHGDSTKELAEFFVKYYRYVSKSTIAAFLGISRRHLYRLLV